MWSMILGANKRRSVRLRCSVQKDVLVNAMVKEILLEWLDEVDYPG